VERNEPLGANEGTMIQRRATNRPPRTRRQIETAALTLPQQEYNGHANSALWPLFHYRLDLVQHRSEFLHASRAGQCALRQGARTLAVRQ